MQAGKERFEVFDHSPMGVFVIRSDFVVLYWNFCLEEWTGIAPETIVGQSIDAFYPQLTKPRYTIRLQQIFEGGPPVIFSSQLHRYIIPVPYIDGKMRIQHTTVSAILDRQTNEHDALFAIQDVTELTFRMHDYRAMRDQALAEVNERKKAEAKMQASLHEKEILLKEIHHRVKNNLQIISSLLDLQTDHISDENSLRFFKQSQARIRSIAYIHEKLYQSEDLTKVDFKEYLLALSQGIFHAFGIFPDEIDLVFDIQDISLSLKAAVPCGLILNEIMTNSIKHAFSGLFENGAHEIKPRIEISLTQSTKKCYELTICDNGKGLPENFQMDSLDTLGLQLVNMLVGQLKGTIEFCNKRPGAYFHISFYDLG